MVYYSLFDYFKFVDFDFRLRGFFVKINLVLGRRSGYVYCWWMFINDFFMEGYIIEIRSNEWISFVKRLGKGKSKWKIFKVGMSLEFIENRIEVRVFGVE